jgi:hypothetical protein
LKLGLSDHPPEDLPPIVEIADRTKALREGNTVEAAPERTATRKAARAERPVTARIRAKPGSLEAAEELVPIEVKTEPVQKPEVPPAESSAPVIAMPAPVSDQKQVASRRQGNEARLRLF